MATHPRDLPLDELFAAALGRTGAAWDPDDEARWDAVRALQARPERATFDRSRALLTAHDPRERLVGVDVIAQLGVAVRPYRDEALPLLVAALDDPDEDVAAAAGIALGHHAPLEAIGALVAHACHPSAEVRLGVVHGLGGIDDPAAIAALLALSADTDPRVRDWATFALGEQLDVDTPEIRAALRARLADPDPEVRDEAVSGLVRRGCAPEP